MSDSRGFELGRLWLLLLCLLAAPALAQPPSTSCDGNENLTSADVLPQSLVGSAPLGNNFTMTGLGCSEEGVDFVTCFTPTNNCDVDLSCNYNPSTNRPVAVNLFLGPCAASPNCISSTAVASGTATITGASLTGGTQYCVVCESQFDVTTLDLEIMINSGDCGALPITLQEFSIGSSEEAAEDSALAALPSGATGSP